MDLFIFIPQKGKIKRLSLSIETLNRGSTLIHPIQGTLKPLSRLIGTTYYRIHFIRIPQFNSRGHFVLFPVRFACSLWQTLSGTFRRITLPVLRLRYLFFIHLYCMQFNRHCQAQSGTQMLGLLRSNMATSRHFCNTVS